MILQALNEYYDRKACEPDSGIPPYGFGEQGISFCLVLSLDGRLRHVVDLRESGGKKAMPRRLAVPMLPSKRSSGVDSNFTWDNTGYVLGVDGKGKPERSEETFEAFKTLHREISEGCGDEGLLTLVRFLEDWSPDRFQSLTGYEDMVGANMVFRLEGEARYLHERPQIRDAWQHQYRKRAGTIRGRCLVTGEEEFVAKLHPEISGVWNAQPTGALLVSFNQSSFESFGKEKGLNSPVGERAAFAYTTALNYLLRGRSRQKIQIGDATAVFWAERDTPTENLLALLFNPPVKEEKPGGSNGPEDDPATVARVREVLKAARAGMPLGEVDTAIDPDVRHYILGLSPSEARLSVRFWNVSTFGQLVSRLGRHFADLAIERQFDKDPEYPPLWCLVREVAPFRESKNAPPLLAGALMRSILTGGRYPESLYSSILSRIRADHEITYLRAAILKACLIRNHGKEIPVSLDSERKDPAYRLGRLFALLEKVQKDAIGKDANVTIKDRYFGAASATPAVVFPQLLRLGQHHIAKAEYGGYVDSLIAEVLEDVNGFPKHLSLEEQGLFSIGYYHQRNNFFLKKDKSPNGKE